MGITLDMFPEGYREVAEAIGIETALRLCEIAGGEQLYIPKLDSVLKDERYNRLYQDYLAGAAYEELARRYNLSVDSVRRIIRERRVGWADFLTEDENV